MPTWLAGPDGEPNPHRGPSAGMREGYSLELAWGHLTRGMRRPREAMREAAASGLTEPWSLGLFAASLILDQVVDPADDSLLADLTQRLDTLPSGTDKIVTVAQAIGILVGTIAALYVIVSFGIWCFVRLTRPQPALAQVRSALAMATWTVAIPSAALTVIFGLLGFPMVGATIASLLLLTYTSLCLSEATGIEASKAMAFTMAGSILSLAIAIVAASLFGDLLQRDPS